MHFYRAETVTDLNGEGNGGVPALFKSFTQQAGLPDDVFLETHPGVGLDWHPRPQAEALQKVAFDQLTAAGKTFAGPATTRPASAAGRCVQGR